MADVTMSLEEYLHLIGFGGSITQDKRAELQQGVPVVATPLKVRRKVSKYNREFGRQLKRLKAKHPKTQSKTLMKRAHALTKKALKS